MVAQVVVVSACIAKKEEESLFGCETHTVLHFKLFLSFFDQSMFSEVFDMEMSIC